MNLLVCVKRVPQTGGRIVLTPDGQAIDTRFLGFTISPHEECGVEEAVRIVEASGGSATVLTLGPVEAEDQLRDAMAIGADRAILLETDGFEWDPVSTASAIAAAIRDQEVAAESVGVDNFRTKLKVYVVAAAGTGMVGALIYLQKARISPDAAFSVLDWTAYVIFIVVIGGIGTIEGPIIGVLVFYFLQTNLAHFGTWYLILLGLFAIVVMLFAPKGIWGYLSERYGLAVFPIRRRLVERQ